MFCIMMYDVNEKRVGKMLKKSREFLTWIQNSVFEGELTDAKLEKLKIALKKIMDEKEDSVIFYIMRTTKYTEKEIIGKKLGGFENII
jgi:CRISPR-associated protein Cas2